MQIVILLRKTLFPDLDFRNMQKAEIKDNECAETMQKSCTLCEPSAQTAGTDHVAASHVRLGPVFRLAARPHRRPATHPGPA